MEQYWMYVFAALASISVLYLILFRRTVKTENNAVHYLSTQLKFDFKQQGFWRKLPYTAQELFSQFPKYLEEKGHDRLSAVASGKFNEYQVTAFMHTATRHHGGHAAKTIENTGFILESDELDYPEVSLRHRFYIDLFKHKGHGLSLYNRDPSISAYTPVSVVDMPSYLIAGDPEQVNSFLTSLDFTQAKKLEQSKLLGFDFSHNKILFFTGLEHLAKQEIDDVFFKILSITDALKKKPVN
jgi:hypothetical protein